MSTPTDIAAARIRAARRTTVLTGTGVSAASGVPTFRGAGGLWRNHRPEDLATQAAFAHNPAVVWEWYDWRRSQVAACGPNRAHEVLADWSARLQGFPLVTQNVDGLHERTGTSHVTRLHGSLWTLRCWNGCGARAVGQHGRAAGAAAAPLPVVRRPREARGRLVQRASRPRGRGARRSRVRLRRVPRGRHGRHRVSGGGLAGTARRGAPS